MRIETLEKKFKASWSEDLTPRPKPLGGEPHEEWQARTNAEARAKTAAEKAAKERHIETWQQTLTYCVPGIPDIISDSDVLS